MIRLAFAKEAQKDAVCVSEGILGDGELGKPEGKKICFALNQKPFAGRVCRFYDKALLFDGYSVWFADAGEGWKPAKDFSMTFWIAPMGWSDHGDGLFSRYDAQAREGFYVRLQKHGRVEAGFGNGQECFSFSSINAHVKKGVWNAVTVVYWQEAGWCDLYVNKVLSNRKQFARHIQIKWPDRAAYLGKYVDCDRLFEESAAGCFYGLMGEVLLEEKALRREEVQKRDSVYPAGGAVERILPKREAFRGDVQRPAYHLIAPGKWMNEPHGPLYFGGWYHIFYQANPHAPIWDHIRWGHMVSRDMVHWEDLPWALEPEGDGPDPDGCWSGSSLVDREGKPWIFYTAGNNGCFPNQFVAAAEAETDKEGRLLVWRKHLKPVLLQTQGWLGEFRDPFVWMEGEEYFMLVGTGDGENGGGNAVLYRSPDLQSWQSHGFFLSYDYEKNPELGHVFELPVLLPLREESGSVFCHIFLLCACQIEGRAVETYAFLGKWEPEKRKFSPFHERALLLDLGGGIFTGPSGFVTPDGRTVVFSIAQGRRSGREEVYAGWAHNGGLPLELFIREGQLHMRPIREVYRLAKKRLLRLENVSLQEADQALSQFVGNLFWVRLTADAQSLFLETGDGAHKRTVFYDRHQGRAGVMDGTGRQLGTYRGSIDRVDIQNEPIRLEYFMDHSMIEAYWNEKKSVTARNYIDEKSRKIRLGGEVQRILELELWEMEPAYGPTTL